MCSPCFGTHPFGFLVYLLYSPDAGGGRDRDCGGTADGTVQVNVCSGGGGWFGVGEVRVPEAKSKRDSSIFVDVFHTWPVVFMFYSRLSFVREERSWWLSAAPAASMLI